MNRSTPPKKVEPDDVERICWPDRDGCKIEVRLSLPASAKKRRPSITNLTHLSVNDTSWARISDTPYTVHTSQLPRAIIAPAGELLLNTLAEEIPINNTVSGNFISELPIKVCSIHSIHDIRPEGGLDLLL